MKCYNSLGTDITVELESAILIYDSNQRNAGGVTGTVGKIAMVHAVEHGTLGPGSAATIDAVRALAVGLMGSAGGLHLIPTNVLAMSFGCLAWHCPPTRRQMWFQCLDGGRKEGEEKLNKVSGEVFPQPHLVFIATPNHLRVFALACQGRPTAATPIYRAPYWNVNQQGTLCVGSTRFPSELVPQSILGWEKAFFKSRFTHATAVGVRLSRTPHNSLWPRLAGKRRFPVAELVRTRQKLGDLLK